MMAALRELGVLVFRVSTILAKVTESSIGSHIHTVICRATKFLMIAFSIGIESFGHWFGLNEILLRCFWVVDGIIMRFGCEDVVGSGATRMGWI